MHATQPTETREFAFGDKEFRFLTGIVNGKTGIVLGVNKKDMVYSRLVRRLRVLNLTDFASYCDLVQQNDEEIDHLVNALTTNLTSFFREKHHFDHLQDTVLAPLAAQPPAQKRLRIWSAACSSGMEAYSIALVMKAAIKDLKNWDARILATDIDTNMLAEGEAGIYSTEQDKNIPEAFKADIAYSESDQRLHMPDSLKALIAFKSLNLLGYWPMQGPFDAVFCRNVAIYFDKPTQAKLYTRIADLMKPQGWLYIGHSENLASVCDRFELVGRTIYRKVR